jgi:NADPH-dependent curcumin reductase CurA
MYSLPDRATGSAAVQIAKKIIGCKRVIGIAGGPEKCTWVETLGADVCLDYRAPDFEKKLVEATDGYVEVYLDLVGGESASTFRLFSVLRNRLTLHPVLNLMLLRMKRWGKIAAVGAISAYNDWSKCAFPNWMEVIANRLTITGFIVFDFIDEYPTAVEKLAKAVTDGTFVVEGSETVREVSFDEIPKVWRGLFTGANTGKLVTKIVH